MRNLLILVLSCTAAIGMSQGQLPSASSPAGPMWGVGSVEGDTYKNSSLGIELIAAPELQFETPKLNGRPGTVPLVVSIIAAARPKPGVARPVMAFYADALAHYPENRRSSDAYMERVVLDNQHRDLLTVDEKGSERRFGGLAFLRRDFEHGAVYEAVLVRACNRQALVFIFTGPSRDPVDKLMAATQLKLNPATSGCGS